jgi:hypothetical protein
MLKNRLFFNISKILKIFLHTFLSLIPTYLSVLHPRGKCLPLYKTCHQTLDKASEKQYIEYIILHIQTLLFALYDSVHPSGNKKGELTSLGCMLSHLNGCMQIKTLTLKMVGIVLFFVSTNTHSYKARSSYPVYSFIHASLLRTPHSTNTHSYKARSSYLVYSFIHASLLRTPHSTNTHSYKARSSYLVYSFIHASLLRTPRVVIWKAFWIETVMMMDENTCLTLILLTSRPPLGIADETHICTRGKERNLNTVVVVLLVIPWQLPH